MASIHKREEFFTMAADRVLVLEGIHNFRDFGDYPVVGGGRVRRGSLWRSGQHFGATDADLARIAAIGLATVVDLRSGQERETYPCRRPEGFAARVHYAEDVGAHHAPAKPAESAAPHVAAAGAPHVAAAQTAPADEGAAAFASMKRSYTKLPFRPDLIGAMRIFFAELATGQGPALVNCMAGKDRTGLTVALVQRALGMHHDDILEDYLLTNTAGDAEARIADGMVHVRLLVGDLSDAFLRVLLGVDAEYLDTAFAAIAERYGSVEAYMEQLLGVDAATRDSLRAVLVEG